MTGLRSRAKAPAEALITDLRRFAALPRVLIAVDFDGTLAPLVDDPLSARALPGSLELLVELAGLPDTAVAIVSGRALATLRGLTGVADPVLLVGSHGVETSYDDTPVIDEAEAARFTALETDLTALVDSHPPARLERKPHSLVVHTRGMPRPEAEATLAEGERLAAGHEGVEVTPGKDVVEVATRHVGKGTALLDLAAARAVSAILYIGDDVTDERAFAALGPQHLTIRVGPGQTLARHRVRDERQVVSILRGLRALRPR